MKESLVDMLLAYKDVNSKKNFEKLPKKVQKTIWHGNQKILVTKEFRLNL